MDKEMEQFKADLLESVRQMKHGEAARTTLVQLTPAADARAKVGADTADRRHRNHLRHAGTFQGMDVGAVIHQVRRDRVPVAVARHERHFPTTDTAEGERTGWLAIGSTHDFAV